VNVTITAQLELSIWVTKPAKTARLINVSAVLLERTSVLIARKVHTYGTEPVMMNAPRVLSHLTRNVTSAQKVVMNVNPLITVMSVNPENTTRTESVLTTAVKDLLSLMMTLKTNVSNAQLTVRLAYPMILRPVLPAISHKLFIKVNVETPAQMVILAKNTKRDTLAISAVSTTVRDVLLKTLVMNVGMISGYGSVFVHQTHVITDTPRTPLRRNVTNVRFLTVRTVHHSTLRIVISVRILSGSYIPSSVLQYALLVSIQTI